MFGISHYWLCILSWICRLGYIVSTKKKKNVKWMLIVLPVKRVIYFFLFCCHGYWTCGCQWFTPLEFFGWRLRLDVLARLFTSLEENWGKNSKLVQSSFAPAHPLFPTTKQIISPSYYYNQRDQLWMKCIGLGALGNPGGGLNPSIFWGGAGVSFSLPKKSYILINLD